MCSLVYCRSCRLLEGMLMADIFGLAGLLLILNPAWAHADAGVPMIFLTFPSMILALIPIVLIEAGIFSGDYIFVRKQSTADRGEIVVALIGDEATVKYFFPERDYVRFQPANARMAPILVRATDFKPTMLLGKVVGVYRRV